jgi:allantoinase
MVVVRSQRVVTPSGVQPASIRIDGGTISDVRPSTAGGSGEVIDYGNLVISPGLVDSHVHANEPGRTEWEGFQTATRAAAAGGITTIVDMPLNSIPATTTVDALRTKARALAGQCHVDVALWGGVVPGNLAQLQPMLEAGARGFKCFLVDSGVEEFPPVGEDDLRAAARELSAAGAPLLVHAESPRKIRSISEAAGYQTFLESRPPEAEDEAIELLMRVCEETGARIHVVHLSSAGALNILERARKKSLPLSAETTPHYLHFEAESIPPGRTEFKCTPPIRERENREALWHGLREGLVDFIVSDHSPCTPSLKRGDFASAWGGIASLQFVLPIVWSGARERGHTMADLARWLSAGPSALAGLKRKGAIAAGRDADLVVWSPEERFTVSEEIIQHRHKVTHYRGETLSGVVKATWLHGRRVFGESGIAELSGRWIS